MRAFFRKDEQIPGSATWLRTWRPHVRVVPGAPVNQSGSGLLRRSRFSSRLRRELAEEPPVLSGETPQESEPVAQGCSRDVEGRMRVEVAPNLVETARSEVVRGGDLQRAAERVLEGPSCHPERRDEFLDREPVSRGVRDTAIHLEAGEPEVLEPELIPAQVKRLHIQPDGIRIPSVQVLPGGFEVAKLEPGDLGHGWLSVGRTVRISDSSRSGEVPNTQNVTGAPLSPSQALDARISMVFGGEPR